MGIGRVGQEHPQEAQILGGSPRAEPDLVWSTGSVMVKSPLNRELVATYEVTLSVIDNASDLPERSVSVPNGKAPRRHLPHDPIERQAQNRHRPGPREGEAGPSYGAASRQAAGGVGEVAATVRLRVALGPSCQAELSSGGSRSPELCVILNSKGSE